MICLIISLIVIIYAAQILLYAVHMFQQNGYKNKVHASWILKNYGRHFTKCFAEGKAKNRHDPGSYGCSYIGAHYDADRLSKHQQARIYKAYNHDGGCRRRLDYRRYAYTCNNLFCRIGCHGRQEGPKAVAGNFLETAAK